MNDTPKRPPAPPGEKTNDTHSRAAERTGDAPAGPSGTNPAAARPDAPSGTEVLPQLGDYAVVRKLGEGGMGAVYLAEDTRLKRRVAIKTMRPEVAADAANGERFTREAQTAALVEHDNVVPILHVGEASDGTPFIVMPFLQGEMLDARLKREPVSAPNLIMKVAYEVAEGLAAAHARGLIHRDIKPANIWLEGDPAAAEAPKRLRRCKILDFGLARSVDKDDAHITASGAILGTPAYMAPEQARGERVDHRADLWSLGVMLYRMAAGRPPFRGPNAMAVLIALATEAPQPVGALRPDLPPALADLIDRLMQKDANARPQTAAEVSTAVRQIAQAARAAPGSHSMPVVVMPVQASAPAPASNPWEEATETDEDERPIARAPAVRAEPARGRLPWLIGGAVAGLLALAVLAAVVVRFETAEGTLVVELDTPDVEAKFANNALILFGPDGKEKYRLSPGEQNKKLPAGPYTVRVEGPGGLDLNTTAFTLKRGDKVTVRVTLAKPALPPKKDPPKPAGVDGFVPLFSGKDLTGWTTQVGGFSNWKVEDGAITCTGPRDHLYTTRNDFGDFHLRAEAKVNAAGNSGIYFRTGLPLALIGDYEAQISTRDDQPHRTGSLYGLVKVGDKLVPPDTWFTLEVIAQGDRIRVLVNGKESADHAATHPGRRAAGHIALQHHDPLTAVQFRKIEVKELKAANLNADRTAAEWALGLGGVVHIDDGTAAVADAKDLPKEPFRLTAVGLLDNPKATDAGLAALKGCTNLKTLDLGGTEITDAGLAVLRELPELVHLGLHVTAVTDAGLAHAAGCKRLTHVWLRSTAVTDKGLELLLDRDLQGISLQDTKVTAAAVRRLAKQKPGCWIGWDGGEIEPKMAAALDPNRAAADYVLSIGGIVQTVGVQKDIARAADLPAGKFDLATVHLRGNRRVTDDGLAACADLTALARLDLVETPVTDKGAAHFKNCKKLITLDLVGAPIGDEGVAHFAGCDGLANLWLGGTRVTDKGLEHFANCKNLYRLDLSRTRLTDAGLVHFKDRAGLGYLYLAATDLTDDGLAHFSGCKALVELDLSNTKATDAGLAHLKNAVLLKRVVLTATAVTDAGLAHLKGCTDLESLSLDATRVTDAGLATLKGFARLKELTARNPRVTAKGVAELSAALPGCRITWPGGVIEPKK